jgi:PhnB protein
MKIEAYLNFDGRADEAIEFYKKILGAKVERLMRFKDMPDPQPPGGFPPQIADKVMHANLRIGDVNLMLSDGRCTGKSTFSGFNLCLQVYSDAEAEKFFAALAEGGKITMPLDKTFFTSKFGMVTDRFGVPWMIVNQS